MVGAFAGTDSFNTLVVALKTFEDSYNSAASVANSQMININESIKMAATMLSILPLLLMYLVLQRNFVESIDRTGITGE